MEIKEVDNAYAAGVMDSDGCFHITRRSRNKKYIEAMASVGMVYPDVLEWLQERWGGAVSKQRNGIWGTKYQWRIYASNLDRFLKDVEPYLVLKVDRCNLIIEFRATMGVPGRHISDDTRTARDSIYDNLRLLNAPAASQ